MVVPSCTRGGDEVIPYEDAVVTSVADGDTITATLDTGDRVEVRLAGVNAPETGECHFDEARSYLDREILGHRVVLEPVGVDRFGRMLAFVKVDTVEINTSLVTLGHAIATTPDRDDPTVLLEAEEQARVANLGLWADDACMAEGPIPAVRITTVDFDPPGPDEERLEREAVVITNDGDESVDIGNWALRDESSLHRLRFAPATLLMPGASLTVSSASPLWEPGGSPVWNNDGDMAMLLDRSGRVVDAVRY